MWAGHHVGCHGNVHISVFMVILSVVKRNVFIICISYAFVHLASRSSLELF